MFNMQEIGKRIILLRKNKNMTQVDLADKLGITYQAVSSWERGNSMPDIEKIPEIAELFQISIDELIGNSKVVNTILNVSNHEQWKNENLTEEDIKEALPIMKPNQITEIIDSIDKTKINDIEMFLPFMQDEDIKDIAWDAYKSGRDIEEFLPFMQKEVINDIARHAYKSGRDIEEFLPFMQKEVISDIARDACKSGRDIEEFLPFMQKEVINDIARDAYKSGRDIEEFLPFMQKEVISDIARDAYKSGRDIEDFLPFMNKESIREIVHDALIE